MKIAISEKNEEKVEAAIKASMGRARTFVHSFEDVVEAAEEAEARLELLGIPKKDRQGVLAEHSVAGPSSNSFKYSAAASSISMRRGVRGWILTDVDRITVYLKDKESLKLEMEAAKFDRVVQCVKREFGIHVNQQPA